MKKIFVKLIVFSLVMQLFTPVYANENVIYNLDLNELPLGSMEGIGKNISDNGIVEVREEAEGRYVYVKDTDTVNSVGFEHLLKVDGIKTVSFDYRLVPGAEFPAQYYILSGNKFIASITLESVPYYYNGKGINTSGKLTEDVWTNITLVLKPNEKKFDMYQDGLCIVEGADFRDGNEIQDSVKIMVHGHTSKNSEFNFKNYVEYDGAVVPELSENMLALQVNPERTLVDYGDSYNRLNSALKGAIAMTIGNSVARVDNKYVNIYPGEIYVAPYISHDGSTMVPARFVSETIGCNVEVLSLTSFRISKDGTGIEFNTGDKNAIINGQVVEMPSAPVIVKDRLFVPLRFVTEYFGKTVFWDDRGLIVISDNDVVKSGDEELLKPLISDIRNHTTVNGNKKYSDVNYSARYFRTDGYDGGQMGALDAAKRFMATVNRWTYVIDGNNNKAFRDQGLLVQGTLNANVLSAERNELGSKNATTFFLGGERYTRADGVNGTTWGCVCNPNFFEEICERAKSGIDNGLFMWQFDDWALNESYRLGGCHCDYCNEGFSQYVKDNVSPEEGAQLGITDVYNFDYVEYLKAKGITNQSAYASVVGTPIDRLRIKFYIEKIRDFHARLLAYMEEYSGIDQFFSINLTDPAVRIGANAYTWLVDEVDGVMGETKSGNMSPGAMFASMLVMRSIGKENIVSPVPKDPGSVRITHSAIPMAYATGQFMLVPWDTWLHGSTRYYATLEELGGTYELPREYPFLFDNYETPEVVGYVFDFNESEIIVDYAKSLLDKGIPARALVRETGTVSYTFDETDFYGLQAVIAAGELPNLTEREKELIENSGIQFIPANDNAAINNIENTFWTVRNNDSDISTVLRTNKLYDNAPVVVHAVNYNTAAKENVEIEINNMYLPQGNNLKVNVYKPQTDCKTISVKKGETTTKFVIDSVDRWTVLEFYTEDTVRRDVSFNIGDDYNGIGMGTRISNDKAYGTPDNFDIVTYSEGLNSTTYGDVTGTQDEAAFVYKRLSKSRLKSPQINAGFGEHDGAHGVMVRDGIYSNARFVALMYDPQNGLRLAKRGVTNKGVMYTNISKEKPEYMQLVKEDEQYKAYISDDGINYKEVASTKISFDAPVGGVFAASPDGSKSVCHVHDFYVLKGNYPPEEITEFKIGYGDGTIKKIQTDAKLNIELSTSKHKNLSIEDADFEFSSSDENVLKITSDGSLVPVKEGVAQITATAKMGFVKDSQTATIQVVAVDPIMFEESFSGNELPAYIKPITKGNPHVKDGVFRAVTSNTGEDSDVEWSFEQYNMPTVFEFDFKANFGTQSASTGARVIYANDMTGMALTADKKGFYWFFGDSQELIMPIEQNKWYHIRLEADYESQTANVYIDGTLAVENGQTRGSILPNGSVRIGGWRLGSDSCYEWDNFKFYFVEE